MNSNNYVYYVMFYERKHSNVEDKYINKYLASYKTVSFGDALDYFHRNLDMCLDDGKIGYMSMYLVNNSTKNVLLKTTTSLSSVSDSEIFKDINYLESRNKDND